MRLMVLVLISLLTAGGVAAQTTGTVRAQLDTVGFAVNRADFAKVLYAATTAEDLNNSRVRRAAWPAVAAILPHDDYLYAGRTAVHALPYLQARRWVIFGVCHACRHIGVRDRLLLDDFAEWRVAGQEFTVDQDLRETLLRRLGAGAEVSPERQTREHSVEALLPWLGAGTGQFTFVSLLVPGMEMDRLTTLSGEVADILAAICRERGWVLGRDLGILISADAVHYGCDGWGDHPYNEFGCDAVGHAKARAQDIKLARGTLAGPLTVAGIAGFVDQVWNPEGADYPTYPYRITWCGLYSIPFGLSVALQLQDDLDKEPLQGTLLRYGDSVSDGKLSVATSRLGVTAPNTLAHWVGYPAVVYR